MCHMDAFNQVCTTEVKISSHSTLWPKLFTDRTFNEGRIFNRQIRATLNKTPPGDELKKHLYVMGQVVNPGFVVREDGTIK